MHASVWTYAWDLMDEGISDALRRIRDEAGCNCVSVATSYHGAKVLLPHNPRRKVLYLEDGAIYFQPQRAWYAGLKIQPHIHSSCRERNVLAEIVTEANKLGVKVISWTVCCHNYTFGSLHPDCTLTNCFGDRYLTSLCPSNEDVRQYLIALTGDLAANYDLHALELEALEYMTFEHGFHHEKNEIFLPPMMSFFLSLCFCDGCKRAAQQRGVDANAVQSFVRSELEAFFEEPTELSRKELTWESVGELVDGQMGGYLMAWTDVVTSLAADLVSQIRDKHGKRVHLFSSPHPSSLWQIGVDIERFADYADALEVLAYGMAPADLTRALILNQQICRDRADLIIGLHPSEKYVGSKEAFIEQVRLCKQRGVSEFSFYNYGLICKRHLHWIKEALEA